ncbi:erythromycin esterase family protein [Candidatus Paracaedibacter symbiosus]|uniref:erythromycin esterase family protein n=1 Tax=Candidatus Paracaedibacter symbiosus TaxID=244582 RepID=UPI00050955BC|nr:erythromycin esterase family protein [Candidatus Paracaedibacter symbiosus]
MLDQSNLKSLFALPFDDSSRDYSYLLKNIGDAHLVLIGEATHGTHEFYKIRSQLTKQLIEEKGFHAIAIEGDWPDVYNLNKYAKNFSKSIDEYNAIKSFERFPSWMWCNDDMLEFVKWLRTYNDFLATNQVKIGIYGLDLYSLHTSMDFVIHSLAKRDPQAAERARIRYECLQKYRQDPINYAYAIEKGIASGCEEEVYDQLTELLELYSNALSQYEADQEDLLSTLQNARVVVNAEAYYRALLKGPEVTWNLRDNHMMATLEDIRTYYYQLLGSLPKIIIWAHNSHVGDARATSLTKRGEINIGQLARERYGNDCYLIGFSTYQGEVTAASTWGGVTERKKVRPALEGSYEYLFHHLKIPDFLLLLGEERSLTGPYLQRAIGVIYHPETERMSHYYYASLSQQFNAIIHIDTTSAVRPFHKSHVWEKGEFPETFPTGL